MKYVNGNTPKCRDCRYYEPLRGKNDHARYWDGFCRNRKHVRSHGNSDRASGYSAACFDAEDRDSQYSLFEKGKT